MKPPNKMAPVKADWLDGIETDIDRPSRIGLLVVAAFVCTIGIWAIAAPLSGAAIAVGQITVDAQNQQVQHPRGGVVSQIFVKDGQMVKKGDLIVRLDQTADRSSRDKLQARKNYLTVLQDRLQRQFEALQSANTTKEIDAILQSVSLSVTGDPRTRGFSEDQTRRLRTSITRVANELESMRAQRRSLEEDRAGRIAERDSAAAQAKILSSEVERMRPIVRRGYIARSRLDEAERSHLDAVGRAKSLTKTISSLGHKIREIEKGIVGRKSSFLQEISDELARTRIELNEASSELTASEHVLNQTEVRAPVTGRLVKLASYTVGGVIAPNTVIAEIVPVLSQIIAEGRLNPADVETVGVNQSARVMVSALKSGLVDDLKGSVSYVSPDAIFDERQNLSYYLVRIRIKSDQNEPATLDQLKFGMPVEIYVQTSDRTFLSYLLKPISDSFRRAFREQ